MRLGLIGYGTIAGILLEALNAGGIRRTSIVCLVRPESMGRAQELLYKYGNRQNSCVTTSASELIDAKPDCVVECASQDALSRYAELVLRAGIDLIPVSLGALSDEDLYARAVAAARGSGARLHLLAGAIGRLDILTAARLSGLSQVTYVSRKPPQAWIGTSAERTIDLSLIEGPVRFYRGNARIAVRDYPKNANVAAAVSLTGIGFDRTQVELIADPTITSNIHELLVRSDCCNISFRIENKPSAHNPKTSLTAGFSIARVVLNLLSPLVV